MAAPTSAPAIRKLEEEVVNRIAAGEVIHRPASALKELLENSLDAGATQITVVAKQGGLRLLQIQDNGHGIRLEDLPIVCERFTTSKLRAFDDLRTIRTFGFRGEALASITHVARVTITTMTEGAECAYTAQYSAGRLVGPGRPQPCAGTRGTIITVEDLFYNVPARRKALKSPADEYQRIVEVVTRYAVAHPQCGVACRRAEAAGGDVNTLRGSDARQNIALLFGRALARDLLPISCDRLADPALAYRAEGLVSGADYGSRKSVFILFINGRLVDCGALKRAIEAAYQSCLSKNAHPFVYLSLFIKPEHLDVNVHPTKKEVHFLHEAEVTADLHAAVAGLLAGLNGARAVPSQPPPSPSGAPAPTESPGPTGPPRSPSGGMPEAAQAGRELAYKVVRVAEQRGAMERYLQRPGGAGVAPRGPALGPFAAKRRKRHHDPEQLTSVANLLAAADTAGHPLLGELFETGAFVGSVTHRFCLAQLRTGLYIIDTCAVTQELCRQVALQNFAHHRVLRLASRPALTDLLAIALDLEGVWLPEYGEKAAIVTKAAALLRSKAEMLGEYFALQIDAEGRLCGLPQLLPDYVPPLCRLPLFLLRLATDVDWDTEQRCFETMVQELGDFYAFADPLPTVEGAEGECRDAPFTAAEPPPDASLSDAGTPTPTQPTAPSPSPDATQGVAVLGGGSARHLQWLQQHVVWPMCRTFLVPPKRWATDGAVVQVACLEQLYRVFERC